MTLDCGIHHFGTKPLHHIPLYLAIGIGFYFNSAAWQAFGSRIAITMLASILRVRASHYRYRVRPADPDECSVCGKS